VYESDQSELFGTSDKLYIFHLPGLSRLIKEAGHFYFTICICPEEYDVKRDIPLVRIHFTIAIHDLELVTNLVFDHLVCFNKRDGLIVGDGVHDRAGVQEPPINKEVEKEHSHEAARLVVSESDQLAKLLLSLARHFLMHLVLCFVFKSLCTSLFILIWCQGTLDRFDRAD
jgi:hypothetical protein